MGILGREILLKSDFPSVWRRVDTVKLYLHFFLIAKLMTGCFLRLRGKGGFTNCACCSRMIILLHLRNVSLNLFSVHTAFSQQTSIVLSCRWSVSISTNDITGTSSGMFDTDRYDFQCWHNIVISCIFVI